MIILEEFWKYLQNETTANFIEGSSRTTRKNMGSLVLVTQHLKDYFKPDVPAATKAFDCCSWKIMLPQEIDTLQGLKEHPQLKVFLGNEQQEALLCSLRPNPPHYSELAIFGPGIQGIIARLPLDEFIRMLYSTNPQEYQAIEDERKKGLSIIEAIIKVLERRKKA